MQDIRDLNPCYDPIKYLPEDWAGSVEELLCYEHIPAKDRLWVAARPKFLPNKILREFALACARSVEHFATDPRVKKCNDINELYLDGEASEQDLRIASTRPFSTAYADAYTAATASAAAYNAARATADDIASGAAYAYTTAVYTAYAYAVACTYDTYGYAAYAASRNDQEELQCSLLLMIIEMESSK